MTLTFSAFPPYMWALALTAAMLCSIGFKKFVYFISIGYGFAVAGEGVVMLLLFRQTLTLPTLLALIILIAYALRLGLFLAIREWKSASYRREAKTFTKDGSDMSFASKLGIFISVTALYVMQVTPIFYRLSNGAKSDASLFVGLVLMLLGVALETVSDLQKAKAKRTNPDRFCSSGLFSFVRCPNYLGELTLWTGVFVSGLGALHGWQFVIAVIGYLCIAYVMFSGARRLECRQNKRYGGDPEYCAYVKSVPILLPFVPLYSVAEWKWIIV